MENCFNLDTPIGRLALTDDGSALLSVCLAIANAPSIPPKTDFQNCISAQISEYFAGQRTEFSFPIELIGTEFQKKVWESLRQIPFGETRTYGEIAQQIGLPQAARAVGMACNRNRLLVVVPCHRVVGQTGSLTGFAAGLEIKQTLLELEKNSDC